MQELYERIAAGQINPPYWPPKLETSDEVGLDAERKRVNPEPFSHVPRSQPTYMWWGINCSSRHGIEAVALTQDLALLDVHAERYHDRWRLLEASKTGRPLAELSSEIAEQFAEQAIEDIIGATVPFFGLLTWLGKKTYAGISGTAARRRRLFSSEQIAPDYTDVVDQVAAMLDRTARPGMPVVLVIEDLHHADAVLIDLLSRLIANTPSTAVLILSTGQSGHIEHNSRLNDLLEAWDIERVDRLSPGGIVPQGFPAGALEELPLADRTTIVHQHFENLTEDVADAIALRYENPLALELFCRLGPVKRMISDGEFPTSEILGDMPKSIKALYEETWRTLPQHIKHAYTLASLAVPSQHSSRAPENAWSDKLVVAAALAAKHDQISAQIATGVSRDTLTYGWCRILDGPFRKFSEDDFRDLAHDDDSIISVAERDKYLRYLLLEADQSYPSRTEPEDAAHDYFSWLLIALEADTKSSLKETTVRAVLHLLGALKSSTRNIPRRLEITDWILQRIDPVSRDGIAIRGNRADAHQRAGELELAVSEYTDLYQDGLKYFGSVDPDTLITQNNLGTALEDAGYFERAISLHVASLDYRIRIFGEYSREALTSRLNLGSAYKSAGQTNRAVAQYRAVLDIQEQLNDKEEEKLLNQVSLVSSLLQAGQFSEVIERVEILMARPDLDLASSERFLPPLLACLVNAHRELRNFDLALDYASEALRFAIEHAGAESPLAIEALVNLASLRDSLGSTSEALALLREAEMRSRLVFGTYGLFTINVKKLIARALLRLGAASEARSVCNAALDVAPTRYESDHPTVLELHLIRGQSLLLMQEFVSARSDALAVLDAIASRSRDNVFLENTAHQLLADVARDSGDVGQAVELFSQMLSDAEREDEPDERWIMHLRNSLASCFALAGHFAESAKLFELVAEYDDRVFGEGHHNTIAVKLNLSRTLRDGGRVMEAVVVLENLVQIAKAGLDPLDPLLHLTLSAYGATLIRSGRAEEGLDALRISAKQARDQFGDDHIYSLSLQSELGSGLIEVNNYREAAELLSALRGPAVDKLGLSNPEVMTIDHNLLIAKLHLGLLSDVVDDARSLVTRRTNTLGAGHQNTLLTTDVLGGALRITGNLSDATTVYSAAARDAAAALGEGNVRTLSIKSNLASCLTELGEHDSAIHILRDACEEGYKALDPDTREFVNIVHQLTSIYIAQNQTVELAAHLERYFIDLCAVYPVMRSHEIPELQLEVARLRLNAGATPRTYFTAL